MIYDTGTKINKKCRKKSLMIRVDYKIEHQIEYLPQGHPKNCKQYCINKAKKLNMERLVYLFDKCNWLTFEKGNFIITKGDFLIFSGLEPCSKILVWDDCETDIITQKNNYLYMG